MFNPHRILLPFLLLLTGWIAQAHRIDIAPGTKQCYFEDLHTEDQMTITYQVGGGGNMDIDFFLHDPLNSLLSSIHRKPTGTFTFKAATDGRHTYCFSNEMSSVSPKILSFNVHGTLFIDSNEQIAPVEHEIRQLSAALQGVKDEQEYIVVRERVHRNTAESTNSRVKYWGILQTLMLAGVCLWNIHYMKSWFEVKRIL